MLQARENPTFARQAISEHRRVQADTFDRHALFDSAVVTLADPDVTHATTSDAMQQAPRPDLTGRWRLEVLGAEIALQAFRDARQLQQSLQARLAPEIVGDRVGVDRFTGADPRDPCLHRAFRLRAHRTVRPCAQSRG